VSALPIAISCGDPGGVGPIVALRAARALSLASGVLLFGDAAQLSELARTEGIPVRAHGSGPDERASAAIALVDVGRVAVEVVASHAPSAEAGAAQLRALDEAARFVREGRARALVTGPTSKEAIVRAGHSFIGQTEHLSRSAGLAADAATMMFLGPKLRVALVTTHLGVADVPRAITTPRVQRTVCHLAEALLALTPRATSESIEVLGLNPHAGEAGLFGREEIDVIGPALRELSGQEPFSSGRIVLRGPSPAESALRAAQRGDVTGVVAMMHDQATIASKLLDWGHAVNVTWGLPFVRTSVDHGVAYDAARSGRIDDDGMRAALSLADRLTEGARG
jgi:4-hydroxythreonine-4-phosphate dehydrogenase